MAYGRVLSMLADPTRRHVFERLAERPLSVGELAEGMTVSRPAVSQHLKALRDADLISVQKQGNRHIYSARPEALGELRAYVDALWQDVLGQFAVQEAISDER